MVVPFLSKLLSVDFISSFLNTTVWKQSELELKWYLMLHMCDETDSVKAPSIILSYNR